MTMFKNYQPQKKKKYEEAKPVDDKFNHQQSIRLRLKAYKTSQNDLSSGSSCNFRLFGLKKAKGH